MECQYDVVCGVRNHDMFKDRDLHSDLDLCFICALKVLMLKSQGLKNEGASKLVATIMALLWLV